MAITIDEDPPVPETVAREEEEEGSEDDNEDDEELQGVGVHTPWTSSPFLTGQYLPPPTIEEAAAALKDIELMLKPPQDLGKGYKDPKLNLLLCSWLEKMKMFLWNYIDPSNKTHGWQAASLHTMQAFEKTVWLAGQLRQWVQAYILD